MRPYLRLMRLDRPIGTWLLFWPCVFGLVLGAIASERPFAGWHDLYLLVLFGIGSVVMRGAGCTYNDIVDRDIDARVARTRGRPDPVRRGHACAQAWLFLGRTVPRRPADPAPAQPRSPSCSARLRCCSSPPIPS